MSAAQAVYFGKVPSRGDFVRSATGAALIQSLDQWMSQTLEQLAEDTGWKGVYDAAAPIHFAILGGQSQAGLAGHMAASQDASGRRFPFVMAASFEIPEPASFLPYSAQALAPLWSRLDAEARLALQARDFAEVQEQLAAQAMEIEVRPEVLRGGFKGFARKSTLEEVEAALSAQGRMFSLRQSMLALGLLLQPVLSQGHAELDKGVVMPLPGDPLQLTHVLTLWIDLIVRFFKRTPAEVALFVTTHDAQPVLVAGFQGALPATLRGVIDPLACRAGNVAVAESEWVEDWVDSDYALRKLSNHLRDPSLSRASAIDLYRETFLGD